MTETTDFILKPEILNEIRNNQTLKNRLQFELGISYSTLYRLIGNNDERLTTAKALSIISEELTLPQSELMEQVKRTAK